MLWFSERRGEAEALIKDKRLFSVSLFSFVYLSNFCSTSFFFPITSFFLIYCSGKHIPPTLYSMPAGWESAVQPPVKAEMHITHILALANFAIWGLDKHKHKHA